MARRKATARKPTAPKPAPPTRGVNQKAIGDHPTPTQQDLMLRTRLELWLEREKIIVANMEAGPESGAQDVRSRCMQMRTVIENIEGMLRDTAPEDAQPVAAKESGD